MTMPPPTLILPIQTGQGEKWMEMVQQHSRVLIPQRLPLAENPNHSTPSRVASSNIENLSVNTTENDLEKGGAFETSRHGGNAKALGVYKGTICMAKRCKKVGRITFGSSNKTIFSLLKTAS
uniref:Uncharacterized protein n=1 Tax=Romanomermis culicivorax TaxID=13658 RepID=A0A915HRA0_ROMCU